MEHSPKSEEENEENQQQREVSASTRYEMEQERNGKMTEIKTELSISQLVGRDGLNPNSEEGVVKSEDVTERAQGVTIQQTETKTEEEMEESQPKDEDVCTSRRYETRQKTRSANPTIKSDFDTTQEKKPGTTHPSNFNELDTSSKEEVGKSEDTIVCEESSTIPSQEVPEVNLETEVKAEGENEEERQQTEVVSHKRYETRQNLISETRAERSIDWKRTKKNSISQVTDSDEPTTSSEEDTDEYEYISESDTSSTASSQGVEEMDRQTETKAEKENEVNPQQIEVVSEEDREEEKVVSAKRKKKTAVLHSSDSGSDSDVPAGKASAKRRRVIEEDEESNDENKKMSSDDFGDDSKNTPLNKNDSSKEIEESSDDDAYEKRIKRRRKRKNLERLAEKRRSRSRSNNFKDDEHDENSPVSQAESNGNKNSDSMEDFIVDDDDTDVNIDEGEKRSTNQELFKKHHINTHDDLYSHLSRIIKALLINTEDATFLKSLYEGEREKRYAKAMLSSLDYVDKRVLSPRLVNLSTSSKWSKRYKDRVECYPQLTVYEVGAHRQRCEACGLHRCCRYQVTLSGQLYDSETFENDDFLQNDKQGFVVGKVCARRTEVYHQLKHFKYDLYQACKDFIDKMQDEDTPVKELVKICFSRMENEGFIQKNVNQLERYLDEADYFKTEIID